MEKSGEKGLAISEWSNQNCQITVDPWFDDSSILDIDYFVKTIATVKSKDVRPDLVGSIITHYASKWLPELSGEKLAGKNTGKSENFGSSQIKKRFFVETLASILPQEKDSVPCGFVFRLLRTAMAVGAEPSCRVELEQRAGSLLEHATLHDLMIPAFSHTSRTLLDLQVVLRVLTKFLSSEEGGATIVKVAKLIDCYLAEAALDGNLTVMEFEGLAAALPSHARACEDGLYRAIDTYLKAHPGLSKQDRKRLCCLLDGRKLSQEACIHAAHNDRVPVRTVIHVLLSDRTKLHHHPPCNADSGTASFRNRRSPPSASAAVSLESPAICQSRREIVPPVPHTEIRRLREDLLKLQVICQSLQLQVDKLVRRRAVFPWKKLGRIAAVPFLRQGGGGGIGEDVCSAVGGGEGEGCGFPASVPLRTPQYGKSPGGAKKGRSARWRNSVS
ncbi:coleoptile phototropism protein 1 [Amborella trichopoda]|uniref:coleoptile phototropism protein 1 n=1 Tax=Amborella trichopoda TaxID=13333 RepID=UPI0005D3D240|nr:coleoptile phototropism protein 1 [Amborella trichopoda]|eukprot:XP_006829676.2 coleoptile phototropism protein 1 [Amborella trichopoda]